MEARRASVAEDMRQEDITQPADGVEARSEVSVVPPPTEPNVIPSESELPLSLSIVPSAEAVKRPQ